MVWTNRCPVHAWFLKQTVQCFESVTEGAFTHAIFSGKLPRLLFSVVLYCDASFVLKSSNTFCVIVSLLGYSEVIKKLVRLDRL